MKARKLAKPRKKARPVLAGAGYDGRFEIGSATVDDPYEKGLKLNVAINVRHDVLIHWHSRKMIDAAQFEAGRRFQRIWERAEIGAPGAIRYDKPHVDGGFPIDPLTDQVIEARREMIELRSYLGEYDYGLACRIIGQGQSFDKSRYIGQRVRDALTALAGFWGTTGPARARIRAERIGA